LKARGFRHSGFANGQHQFDSLAGNIKLRFANGNVDTLAIGDLAGLDMQDRSNINRFLLITCGVDESIIPAPQMPGAAPTTDEATDEVADKKQEVAPDDDARREYQKQLNAYKEMMEKAHSRARTLNQVHADWLYVITQSAVGRLFPPLDSLAQPTESGQ
jgi:hypothetical protein